MLLRPGQLSLDELQAIHAGGHKLMVDPQALPAIQASAAVVQAAAAGSAPVYGVNTGFGKLASTRISSDDLATLQWNLIRSHSVGVGEPLAAPVVRLMLALKAASLARGHSGVRPVVIDTLLAVHNAGLVPLVPSQGSVGASGDLAPLSHMTLALMGEGEFIEGGRRIAAADALRAKGIAPLVLQAKEGPGADQRHADQHRAGAARAVQLRAGAGSGAGDRRADGGRRARQRRPLRPAHPRAARPARADRRGGLLPRTAQRQRRSAQSHVDGDDRVQDPYCLRCQPQVVGACLDQLRHAALVLLREANAVTDNPLVFTKSEPSMQRRQLPGAEPVALALPMANAIAEVAIAERRGGCSSTPTCRACRPSSRPMGLNSGFMIMHVTAAALSMREQARGTRPA